MCCTFGLLPFVVLALLQPILALTQHALYAVVVWTPAALIFPALEHVVRVILIFVPLAYLLLLATAALCCLLLTPANSLHLDFRLHARLLHLQ